MESKVIRLNELELLMIKEALHYYSGMYDSINDYSMYYNSLSQAYKSKIHDYVKNILIDVTKKIDNL